MRYTKAMSIIISITILLGVMFSGCIFSSAQPLSIEYEITIENPNTNDFNLSVPILILGNRFYNTPREDNLTPIVDVEDYSVINGTANLDYRETQNSTLLQINSSSKNVKVRLLKNEFDKEEYSEYKDVEYYDSRIIPFLNSYYNGTSGNYGSMEDKIGIIYHGCSSVNVSINFEMIEEEGDQYTLDDSFTVEDNGFKLKGITIKFKQPAP